MPINFNQPTERGIGGIPQPAPGAPGGGLRGFANRFGRGAVRGAIPDANIQGGLQVLAGPAAALPRAVMGGIRDAVTGSTWYQNLFGGTSPTRNPASQPGGSLPSWMSPNAPMPQQPAGWNPNTPGAYGPVYNEDQTHAGPPRLGENGVLAPMPRAPSGPVGPSRNNTTIAEGEAAVDWARGLSMANSGLNASGGSFDRLNNYANNIQR